MSIILLSKSLFPGFRLMIDFVHTDCKGTISIDNQKALLALVHTDYKGTITIDNQKALLAFVHTD